MDTSSRETRRGIIDKSRTKLGTITKGAPFISHAWKLPSWDYDGPATSSRQKCLNDAGVLGRRIQRVTPQRRECCGWAIFWSTWEQCHLGEWPTVRTRRSLAEGPCRWRSWTRPKRSHWWWHRRKRRQWRHMQCFVLMSVSWIPVQCSEYSLIW